ncbi:putative glycoside hydrolase [Allokutzneria albata]|uniref:DUF4015 domain-containing protein n=1 Tax=Allokutzneria albata TaxID=211114 RepID=A0A1G9Y475_ALLAB|nr:putative glycoside hydrolase [Allokutzneria albata]SDN03265.1 hypothetical protein SAMN04489726_4557 [Allokutzneria albata]
MGRHSLKRRGTTLVLVALIVTAVLAAVGLALALVSPVKPAAELAPPIPGPATSKPAPTTTTADAEHPGMRALHLTAHAWSVPALRDPVLNLVREHKIDTVELDIKDESGKIGYPSALPRAREIGAIAHDAYDAKQAVEQVHALGGKVVGRLVVFRDPVLGAWAWQNGHRDMLVQRPNGQPWSSGYGKYAFTNLAHPEVRAYNLDLAVEAAGLGFDDILYDYIRRPDGPLAQMRFPGLSGSAEDSVTSFVADSGRVLRERGALLGVSVFGIAVSSPTSVAQDIPALARHADYIAPMVYPSHWGKGEYGVSDPNADPYEIVKRSLGAFAEAVRGGRAVIIPWLQDFSLGRTYGPQEVRAQIQAAHDAGMPSFLLWNAGCRYHAAALSPR